MPKSKRAKVVPLTKVAKKGKARKAELIEAVKDCVPKYRFIYILRVTNCITTALQSLRESLKPATLYGTKNRVMAAALAEHNLECLEEHLKGNAFLLFSDEEAGRIRDKISSCVEPAYASPGEIATTTVQLPAGRDALSKYQSSMDALFRKLGMPVQLHEGQLVLKGDFSVCTEGEALSSNAAKILRQLGIKMSTFGVDLVACYNSADKVLMNLA